MQRSLYQLIAECTYDWETWIDETGSPRWINAAVTRITGYEVQECLALPGYPSALVLAEDRPVADSVLLDAAGGGSGNDVEFRILRKDGAVRWVAVSWQPLRDAAGNARGFRTSVRDIDDRKHMEDELRRTRKLAEQAVVARTELLANVSHELRTPIHCIAGFAELLRGLSLAPRADRYAQLIGTQCAQLARQVEDLLQLAALEAGGVRLSAKPMDLVPWVRDLTDAMQPLARTRGLSLSTALPQAAWVEADSGRLSQVLQNLLDNALKYTERGDIVVSLRAEPRTSGRLHIELCVRDSGIGMSADELERVVTPFVQVDGSMSRSRGGVGLGLAIVQRLVRQMGGRLALQSEPDRGTQATVTLDLATTTPSAASQTPSPSRPPGAGGNALIVDDSGPSRELLRAMLETAGWTAAECASGGEALHAFATQPFDLVLLDYQMPETDGAEVARALRNQQRTEGSRVPIYMLSANQFASSQLAETGDVDGVLLKPLTRDALWGLLNRLPKPAPPRKRTGQLDEDVIADLKALATPNGQTMFQRLLPTLSGEIDQVLGQLRAALEANDAAKASQLAHTLAGHTAVLGARHTADLARELETRLQTDGLDAQSAASVRQLERSWRACFEALSALVG